MRTLLCLSLATLLGGCSYWTARLRDFDDCYLVSGHVGVLASADARVGPIDAGLGFAYALGFGKPTWWRWSPKFGDMNFGIGVIHFYGEPSRSQIIVNRGRISFACCTLFGVASMWSENGERNVAIGNGPHGAYSYDQWVVDQFAIEAGVLAIVGVRAGINLAEIADFALGWFGIDLIRDLRDDDYKRPRPPDWNAEPTPPPGKPRPDAPKDDAAGRD